MKVPTLAELHASALLALKAQLRDVIGDDNLDSAKRVELVTNVTRAIASLTAEARKNEAHKRKTVGEMTQDERDGLVTAYIADMPKPRRDALRKKLDELDVEDESRP